MKIAFDPFGNASFRDDSGQPMTPKDGVKAVMVALGLTTARELGLLLGKERRTVNGWVGGRRGPSTAAMLVMQKELEKRRLIGEKAPKLQ